MPQAGFDPPGEKWQLCLKIVVALPPKPPRLDLYLCYLSKNLVTIFVNDFLWRIVMATKQWLKHWIAIHQQFVTSILQRKRQG